MYNTKVFFDPARVGQTTGGASESLATDQTQQQFSLPMKRWFTLKEACELKNLNYKTACNRTYLQPHGGATEGRIGGRKCWSYETIFKWIDQVDEEIEGVRS